MCTIILLGEKIKQYSDQLLGLSVLTNKDTLIYKTFSDATEILERIQRLCSEPTPPVEEIKKTISFFKEKKDTLLGVKESVYVAKKIYSMLSEADPLCEELCATAA